MGGVPNVRVTGDVVVKPRRCPPPPPPSSAPLTVFDLAMPTVQMPFLYVFRGGSLPDNQTLMTGLAEALVHYPHLAGSFSADRDGRPRILLDGAGVRVIETTAGSSTLAEHLPLRTSMDLSGLLPPLDGVQTAQFQLNRFACGGLVLGSTVHHLVCDACSMSSFMRAWSAAVNGLEVDPLPYHDRSSLPVPTDPVPRGFSAVPVVRRCSASTVNLDVHFSKDFIASLKAHVVAGSTGDDFRPPPRPSTYQCLAAHVWKTISRARKLDGDAVSVLDLSVNGRKWVKPAMPAEYFGNLVLRVFVRMKVEELLSKSYAEVARAIRDAISEACKRGSSSVSDGEYGMSEASLSPGLVNTSLLGLGLEEVRFGGSRPCSMLFPCARVDGMTAFLPSCEGGGGGVDVFMAVEKETADAFLQVSHLLDAPSW